ncbi:MAG: ArnT family glycosyltransferase, partial [Gammaproteobacteria bacterium]
LALLTRMVSALMGVGVVLCAYVIGSILFGKRAGLVSAVLITGCYPIVYFAHTSNVDVPALFWTALAVAAVLVCADYGSRRAAVVAGLAAGMALFTKEQIIGVLIALPVVWLLRLWGRGTLQSRESWKHVATAGGMFLAVTVVAGNLWWNPAGFVNRWLFLLGMLPPEIRAKYAPYQFSLQKPTGYSVTGEMTHLLNTLGNVVEGLTAPVAIFCVLGAAWALWRYPRQAAVPLVLALSYYIFSLRSIVTLNVKYTIPLQYLLLILAGAAGGVLIDRISHASGSVARAAATLLAVIVLGAALLPGIDMDRLLADDPRYAAEAWLQAHVPAGAQVETYQSPTRLPRFAPDVRVHYVPMEQRTHELFERRRPNFVVLSSGAQVGLTHDRVADWAPGDSLFVHSEAAQQFFHRLRTEEIGYRRVARFHTPIRWITPPFGSVNPEITIFARDRAQVTPAARSESTTS